MILEARAEATAVYRRADIGVLHWLAELVDLNLRKGDPDDPRNPAGAVRARLIFHPHDPGTVEGLEAFSREIGRDLFDARTVQVTEDIERLLLESDTEWPEGGEVIQADEIPWDRGFAWFDKPLEYGEGNMVSLIRAMSWAKLTATLPVRAGEPPRRTPSVRVVFWAAFSDAAADLRHAGPPPPIGDLLLSHSVVLPLGWGFDVVTPRPGDARDATSIKAGMSMLMFLHRLWMFMDMEITVLERVPMPRQARKRLGGSVRLSDIHVILLRRARKSASHDRDPAHVPAEVNWTCRWFVTGHYRHLDAGEAAEWDAARGHTNPHRARQEGADKDHCADCGVRISRWIRPYCKGPTGAPIRHAEELFKLAR